MCCYDNIEIVLKLIESKANLEFHDYIGTALIYACINKNIQIVSYLLEQS